MTEVSNTESNLITPAAERLKAIPYSEVKPLLDAKHEADPVAGIASTRILLTSSLLEQINEFIIFMQHEFLRSTPETPNFVNPHYHNIGEEPIIS